MKKLVDTSEFVRPGIGRRVFSLVQPLFDRKFGFHEVNIHYQNILNKKNTQTIRGFCQACLDYLNIEVEITEELKEAIAEPGPVVVVANHPLGGMDSMALMGMMAEVRQENWKMVANRLLRSIEALKERTVFVLPNSSKANKAQNFKALKEMQSCLKEEGALVMYPAARVSWQHSDSGAVFDLPWSKHPLMMAKRAGARIVFVNISGENSENFMKIQPNQFTKRSIALVRELLDSRGKKIKLTHSSTMLPEQVEKLMKLPNKEEILRAHAYVGPDKTEPILARKTSGSLDGFLTESTENYYQKLSESYEPVLEQGNFTSFIFKGELEPAIMEEIGRLRSKTFRMIGAGTDTEVDLTPEDEYYYHIVATDKVSGKIAGSYRVGFSHEVIEERGMKAMYLSTVFDFKPGFFEKMGRGMELSRSFVAPEFQKSPAILDLLLRTVGRVARKHKCDNFFGSVTISADFTPLSKAVMVDTLDRYYSAENDFRSKVDNSQPFEAETQYHNVLADAYYQHGFSGLNTLVQEVEHGERTVPPLMRYYALFNAKFLSFKVEPTFGNAIYCLLHIPLDEMTPRYRKRILGDKL